jgi:cell wall-associated NlpC family hydrolase
MRRFALLLLGACASHGAAAPDFTYAQASDPDRVEVSDAAGWVATFTNGAYSVKLRGAARTFSDQNATNVTTNVWVRTLAAPFDGHVDESWLHAALADTSPDALAIATQYFAGAPPVMDAKGVQIAGDAAYGPQESASGTAKTADFNDYLGLPWTYADGTTVAPVAQQLHAVDCSGFVRLVWGYRLGLPLELGPKTATAPGVTLAVDVAKLVAGDLVFFDARTDDGPSIDHVGMYLGLDDAHAHRFVSSRKSADGPTMGDTDGASILDGTGLYARTLRAARRL